MPSVILPAFSRGEISPSAYGRVDTEMYQAALRKARNVIVHTTGGISNRPGTVFIGPVKTHTAKTYLFPFQFKIADQYVLEFGNLYMRVIRNDGHVLESTKTITNVTQASTAVVTSTSHGYSNDDEVYITGIGGMTELNGNRYVVANKAADTFELTHQVTGNNINSTGFTAYTSGGTSAKIYEITTPYITADIPNLKMVQSADTITITHRSYESRDLTRTGHAAWTLAVNTYAPVINAPGSLSVAVINTTGTRIVKYAVTAIDKDTLEESLTATAHSKNITGITKANPAVVTATSHGYDNGDEVLIASVGGMTELNGRRFIIINVTANTFELRDEDSSSHTTYTSGGTVVVGYYKITNSRGSNNTSKDDHNQITWAAVSNADRYKVYANRAEFGIFGLIRETKSLTLNDYIEEGNTQTAILPDLSLTPPTFRNPFFLSGTYPGTSSYFEQRQVYGGSTNNPDTSYYSQVGHRLNMSISIPSVSSDAITATLPAREVHEIRHFVPKNDLIVFTLGGEWRINATGDAGFEAASLRQKLQSTWGCSHIVPLITGSSILFVPDNLITVRALGYSFREDSYLSSDLTALNDHFFNTYTIDRWTYTSSPESRIYGIRSDGSVFTIAYDEEQKVIAWTLWDTSGSFEDITSLKRSLNSIEDGVYFTVQRTIDGNTVRYIERLATRRFNDIRDCFFVDCGLSLDTPLIITNSTTADPVVVTSSSHGLSDGDEIEISDIIWIGDFDESDNETQPSQLNYKKYLVADSVTDTVALLDPDDPAHMIAATQADPVVITTLTAHGFSNGDMIGILNVSGMTELNGNTYKVANVTSTTFELNTAADATINGTGFTTYTSGGRVYNCEDGSPFNAYVSDGEIRTTVGNVTGLTHLEGESVAILSDGNVISGLSVSSGTLDSDLPNTASRVHVGLKYISDIETLDIENPQTTLQGKRKKISHVTIRFKDSKGLMIGPDIQNLKEMKWREEEAYGVLTALLTGDRKQVLTGRWNSNGRMFMRQNLPLPITILALIPELEIEDAK